MRRTFTSTLKQLCESVGSEFRKPGGTVNITALARAIKINQPTLLRMLEGQSREPSGENADKLCKFFRVNREQLLGKKPIPSIDGRGETETVFPLEADNYIPIAFKEIEVAAGVDSVDGFEIQFQQDNTIQPLFYRRDWIEKRGFRADDLIARTVRGSSMEPALFDEDRILVNTGDKSLQNGIVFMLLVDGHPAAKRLKKRGGEWWITSDNPAHAKYDQPLENERQIIGRIVEKSSTNI